MRLELLRKSMNSFSRNSQYQRQEMKTASHQQNHRLIKYAVLKKISFLLSVILCHSYLFFLSFFLSLFLSFSLFSFFLSLFLSFFLSFFLSSFLSFFLFLQLLPFPFPFLLCLVCTDMLTYEFYRYSLFDCSLSYCASCTC